ncbi:MAG TPA: aminotransferase class I/II-fold pyridoxal phosphate-dependent enzyme [Candidatus Acidoferrum sp.]|nr:aminotransferase class I/II-fold pyridoxal phosphate-dependent enzyme [Candidatus Acidoferrum sp.]
MPFTRRNFFRNIAAGAAVTAGLPPLADLAFSEIVPASRASEPGGPIILSRNENAYGPSQLVIAAMQDSLQFANRYPDPAVSALHARIAQSHSIKAEQLVLGCGSGEILSIAASAFVGPGKKLMTGLPTFEAIGRCAKTVGAEVVEVPLAKNYSHDLAAMLAKAGSATGLIYICNPNNPTGSLTPRKDLEEFIRKLPATTTVLIDEAYHHFVGSAPDYTSFIDKPMNDDRVIVARTFSKVYGLAGIRVGYAVGALEKMHALSTRRLPEGINAVGAHCALVAYDDLGYVQMSEKRNAADRQEFFNQAETRKVQGIPSYTNFAMLQTGRPAVEVIAHFKKNNIQIARLFPSMNTHVRVSFGTPSEMKEFWRVWDLLPAA